MLSRPVSMQGFQMVGRRLTLGVRLSGLRFASALLALMLAVPLAIAVPKSSMGAQPVALNMARNADMLTFDVYATQDDPSIFTQMQIYYRLVKLAPSGKDVQP